MKTLSRITIFLIIILLLATGVYAGNQPQITCGDTITADTTLTADLICPEGTDYALIIGASNLILDLGGHLVLGYNLGTGVFSDGNDNITIKNGSVEEFTTGLYLGNTVGATLENLVVKNLTVTDPDIFIYGVGILRSQDILVRDSLFKFYPEFHKEAVVVYESQVLVNNIEVQGGGVGVNFSFLDTCDPVNAPNSGTVLNSSFYDIRGAGIWVACSTNARVEGNHFSTTVLGLGVGVQGDAPFEGAITDLLIIGNSIHNYYTGVEFRGTISSTVSNNLISDNGIGIMMRQSLSCLVPEKGWDCFYSSANQISGNRTFNNSLDLSHDEDSTGNTWSGNTCETREGVEIPPCTPPSAALTINYTSGAPGSFFTLKGANFPPDSTAAITLNGYPLGAVPTDAFGDLVFLLDTSLADEGEYLVTASVNPSASVRFWLDSDRSTRPQEGSGTVFQVSAGLVPHLVTLPLILR